MKKIFLALSIFCFFFACKKEEVKPNLTVSSKDLEIKGQVFDFETGKGLENMPIFLYEFSKKITILRQLVTLTNPKEIAISDKDGKYSYKFTAYDTATYHVGVLKDGYMGFDGNKKYNNRLELISPLIVGNITTDFTLNHTFNVIKAGRININIQSNNIAGKDTLFFKEHQFYQKNKIDGDNFTFPLNNYPTIKWETPVLADRMTYLSWKLKSEKDWHQDSIFTPYNKTVNFEIKY